MCSSAAVSYRILSTLLREALLEPFLRNNIAAAAIQQH